MFTTVKAPSPLEAVQDFRKAYYRLTFREGVFAWYSKESEQTYEDLVKLGDSISKVDVDRIIGNSGWTTLACQSCYGHFDQLVKIKNDQICKGCLKDAAKSN